MRRSRSRGRFIVGFLAPAVLLYALFVVLPLIQAFALSLYRWRGVSAKRTFVGVENFDRLWGDSVFWQALRNNLWVLVVGGIALISVGVAIAVAMKGSGRIGKVLRGVYLFPQVISLVVVAILWQFLYNPSFGLVDTGLKRIGLPTPEKGWLGDSNLALPAVTVAFLWYALGFYIMLFAAGIQQIPEEVDEAAELDGAFGWRKFWGVTWPMLWSVKRVAATYVVINVMNIFALVYLMTAGGPDRKTEVLLTYLYEQAFKNTQYGYATAIAVANFIVAMGLAGILAFIFRKNPEGARS